MNEVRMTESTRNQWKAWLLTDRPNEWNKECWGNRKIKALESKGEYTHNGETYFTCQGIATINGAEWIVTAQYKAFDNEDLVFWGYCPEAKFK